MNDPLLSRNPNNYHPLRIEIRNLRVQSDGARIAVTVCVTNGEHTENQCFPLTTEQYYELNLKKGEITEERFEQIEHASRACKAIQCGEHLLSYGANTVQALAQKLMRHGYTKEEALAAAEHLREAGLINEGEDMRRELEKCLRKLWGAERIRAHLRSKGFEKETLEALPDLLEDVDFVENCAALIRKHYGGAPSDNDERNRITAGLYRYGYSFPEIREAFRRL